MQNYKKCGVIGCGNVGATTAYTLMLSGMFNELVLVDIDKIKATGEAEDIAHGLPFNAPSDIYAGNYNDLSDAGIVIITAGVSQRQGETRLDLLQRNTKVFAGIIERLKKTSFDGMNGKLLAFCIAFTIVALLSKIVGCGIVSKLCKYNVSDSFKIGVGMMTRGEVALIVSQKGLSVGLLSPDYFTAVILLILVSSIATPIILKNIYAKDEKRAKTSAGI